MHLWRLFWEAKDLGLNDDTIAACSARVRIPMSNGVDSLERRVGRVGCVLRTATSPPGSVSRSVTVDVELGQRSRRVGHVTLGGVVERDVELVGQRRQPCEDVA